MVAHKEEHRDSRTGEINCTTLTEEAAHEFNADDEGGCLDDSDHWIWELALDVAEEDYD
jgi:hypothetical protein